MTFRDFAAFFERHRQKVRFTDAHRCFEEFRGVITADARGLLSRDEYLGLGVRLSLFEAPQRELLYDLLQRYLEWLGEQGLFEPNLVAGQWAARATPTRWCTPTFSRGEGEDALLAGAGPRL